MCKNPDFVGPNRIIDVCDHWTEWQAARFEGDTLEDALEAALTSKEAGENREKLKLMYACLIEPDKQEPRISDLVMLIGRLVHQVRKHDVSNPVSESAMDYLRRKNLSASILREVRVCGQLSADQRDVDANGKSRR